MDLYNVLVGDKIKAKCKFGEIETTVTKINKFTVSTDCGMTFKKNNGESYVIHYYVDEVIKPRNTYQIKDLIDKYGDISGATVIPVRLVELNGNTALVSQWQSVLKPDQQVVINIDETQGMYIGYPATQKRYYDYTTDKNILTTEDHDELRVLQALDVVELIELPERLK